MRVSIIVPVYNEEEGIGKVLQDLSELPQSIEREIIVVDDGSTDSTSSELKKWDGSVVLKYGIRATPTIFLLDNKNTIILKPRTTEELKRKLVQLF